MGPLFLTLVLLSKYLQQACSRSHLELDRPGNSERCILWHMKGHLERIELILKGLNFLMGTSDLFISIVNLGLLSVILVRRQGREYHYSFNSRLTRMFSSRLSRSAMSPETVCNCCWRSE